MLFLTRGRPQRDLPKEVTNFIAAKERFVRDLADDAEKHYARREELVKKCECSKHACSNDFSDASCVGYLGSYPGCDLKERRIDLKNSTCHTPPGMRVDDLSDEVKESICIYRGIDDFVKKNGEPRSAWTYLGMKQVKDGMRTIVI